MNFLKTVHYKYKVISGASGDWKKEGYTLYHKKNDPYQGVFTVYAKDKDGKIVGGHTFRIYPDGKLKQHDYWGSTEREDAFLKYEKTGIDDPRYDFEHCDLLIEREAVEVDPEHQRKGLASGMIEYAEKLTHKKCYPSDYQSPDGAKLWEKK